MKRGHLNVPVIGVAKSGWNLDQFRARANDSLEKHGGVDPAAFEKLSGCCATSMATTRTPRRSRRFAKNLNGAQRPAHYLAIPPHLFGAVVEQLANSGCRKSRPRHRRKTFRTRSRLSPGAEPEFCLELSMKTNIFRIDHYLGKRPVNNLLVFPLRQYFCRVVLEPQLHRERADHHGRGLRRTGPRRFLR